MNHSKQFISLLSALILACTAMSCNDDNTNSISKTDDQPDDISTEPSQDMCIVIKDCDGTPCNILEPCKNAPQEIPEPDQDPNQIENTEELCSDIIDNDNNGFTDCYDENCQNLQYCIDWLANQTLETQCKDNLDNDDDYEIDCDDADCAIFDFCSDENDPDWTVEGESCIASEIGMIPDKSDNDTRKANFKALDEFISSNCSNLIVDGEYYLRPYQKSYQSTRNYLELNRVIKIKGDKEKGGHLHFANSDSNNEICGFVLKPNGGLVVEDMKLSSTYYTSGNAIIDAYDWGHRFHGRADRLMFRNCEFALPQLFRINGVWTHYKKVGNNDPYNNDDFITKDEIPEYGTSINRITVKNCTGYLSMNLYNVGVMNKVEFINNQFNLPCKNSICSLFHWSTSNDVALASALNNQGKSHAIFRNNHISGPDDLIANTAYYSGPFLTETRLVNYEDNTIENFMIRRIAKINDTTGEPNENVKIPPVYDGYLSSTRVIVRNNTIKNVMGIASHYRSTESLNELMKSKGLVYDGGKQIRRYENNTYIIDENLLDRHLNKLLDGGTFEDGTTVNPMYIKDGDSKRKLNEDERNEFIKKNKTIAFFEGHSVCNMDEITINKNTINLSGLYLKGSYIFYTKNFTANENNFSVKSFIPQSRGTINVFEVSPYRFGANQGDRQKEKNASLHTNIEVKNNILNMSEQQDYSKKYKYPENSIPLLTISESTSAAYLDEEGVSHKVPFELGTVTYTGNSSISGPKPVKCNAIYNPYLIIKGCTE